LSVKNGATECYCNVCLREKITVQANQMMDCISIDDALQPNEINALGVPKHLIQGIDYYCDGPYFVFTKWYHLRKGYCCSNGCKHCPYGNSKQV
jgi:hypothetical protein